MTQKEMFQELLDRTQEISNIKRACGITSEILTGNGDPEKGLFNQFQLLKQSVENHHATPHITKEDITQSIIEALPKRTNFKEAPLNEKVGWFKRTFAKQINFAGWIIVLALLAFSAYIVPWDSLVLIAENIDKLTDAIPK